MPFAMAITGSAKPVQHFRFFFVEQHVRNLALLVLTLGLSASLSAQGYRVFGRVTDGSGLPLPGATVLPLGSRSAAVTDVDGRYDLPLRSADEHYRGMLSERIHCRGSQGGARTERERVSVFLRRDEAQRGSLCEHAALLPFCQGHRTARDPRRYDCVDWDSVLRARGHPEGYVCADGRRDLGSA